MAILLLPLLIAATPILSSHPDVASVKVAVDCESPKLTIIHICDWHFVDKERFTIDVRDESTTPLSDAEVDELFEQHRADVGAIQKQQKRVIRTLVKQHGIKQVFHEGFTPEQLPAYKRHIEILKDFKQYLPTGDSGLDRFTRYEYQTDMLLIGVPGQLLIDGHIKSVLPAEEAKAYEAANPVKPDGRIVFDEKANEARENAIVRTLMKSGSATEVLVLGGSHDLSDNVPAGVKLIEGTVKAYPE